MKSGRVAIISLLASALFLVFPVATMAHPSEAVDAEVEEYRGYDRLMFTVGGTLGVTMLVSVSASEDGLVGAGIPVELGLGWRFTDRLGLGPRIRLGIFSFQAGLETLAAPGGWANRGYFIGAGGYWSRYLIGCDDSEENCSHRGVTDAYGPQFDLIGGYRWPFGRGGWGLSLGAAIGGAWLISPVPSHTGLYLGGSGVRLVLDF